MEAAEAEWRTSRGLDRMPGGTHNSTSWLLRHACAAAGRAQIAQLCGAEQVWTAEGWSGSFGPTRAGGLRLRGWPRRTSPGCASDRGLRRATSARSACPRHGPASGCPDEELARLVDDSWDPPVTRACGLSPRSTTPPSTWTGGARRGLVDEDWTGVTDRGFPFMQRHEHRKFT
ncbi:aspartate/tyrosine/aromatic aminotransferase [Kocuria rhizophila]|nr:aspartate/tyrosine/aromatic aminotransferase [Kocuria rhizophila]